MPMVELQTSSDARYYTESASLVAFFEPGLMGRKVFFGVVTHGYEFPPARFGVRSVALGAKAGESARLKIKRINITERPHCLRFLSSTLTTSTYLPGDAGQGE